MPRAMQEAARQAPRIRFELVRLDENIEQKLEKGSIDFFIRPSIHSLKTHPQEPLFEDTHTCVVWRKNSLVGDSIRETSFSRLAILLFISAMPAQFLRNGFTAHHGEIQRNRVVTQDFEAACRLVVGTKQDSYSHESHSPALRRTPATEANPPPFVIPKVTHCLQWHRYQDHDPGHIWLRGI